MKNIVLVGKNSDKVVSTLVPVKYSTSVEINISLQMLLYNHDISREVEQIRHN